MHIPRDAADSDDTLAPLPSTLHRGLIAVTFFGFLSLIGSSALVSYMTIRYFIWRRKNPQGARMNQFAVLIWNLVLADLYQAIGFSMNVKWLWINAMVSHTSTCWAQGWFLNTGDVGSAMCTFAIALHAFADIVFNYRLGRIAFLLSTVAIWMFAYFCSSIGIAIHPDDFYMRAGPWCWIPEKYMNERLWLHYIWIILVEFSSILIYAVTIVYLRRMQKNGTGSPEHRERAAATARVVVAYPMIYVLCTLPAVVVRLHLMAGGSVNFTQFCVIGVFLCSNGWLDALLYSLTRWTLIFGPMATQDVRALETYTTWADFRADHHFGTKTVIESNPQKPSPAAILLRKKRPPLSHHRQESKDVTQREASIVKTETTVDVHREVCSPIDRMMIQRMNSESKPGRSQASDCFDYAPDLEAMPNLQFLSDRDDQDGISRIPE